MTSHKTAVPPYYIYGTDVLIAVNRANVNVSSDRHLWHDLVRRYNLYLDKVTTFLLTLRKSPVDLSAGTRKKT